MVIISRISSNKEAAMPSVYIFQHGSNDLFKIGRTRGDVEKRRKALSTGNPVELRIFDVIETQHDNVVEKYLHQRLVLSHSKESDATEFFSISADKLKQCLQETRDFMTEYIPLLEQTEQLKETAPVENFKEADDNIKKIYSELLEIKQKINMLKFEEEVLENRIKQFIGNKSGIEGIASWSIRTASRLDQNSLKEKYPEIFEDCKVEVSNRTFKLL